MIVMSNYALQLGQKAPLLDENGDQVEEGTTDIAFPAEHVATFSATGGLIFIDAQGVGEVDVTVTPIGGSPVTHTVTVTSPFDWSLGDPEAE